MSRIRDEVLAANAVYAENFGDTSVKSLVEDVQRIRNHPLVPRHIPIYGYIYDVKTGKLEEVVEASEVGKAV